MYEVAEENYSDKKAWSIKNTRDKSLLRLLKSPDIIAGSLREWKTRFLSSNPNELCNGLKTLLQ